MIACLNNYITLSEGCSPTTPESGIYLDKRWPQIRSVNLEAITGTKYGSVNDLWTAIFDRALLAFEGDVRAGMRRQFTRTDIVKGIVSHEVDEPYEATTAAAEYRGVYIEVGNSPYADIHISQIYFYVIGGSSITFYVFDANTGDTLDTVVYTPTTTGYVAVPINKTYSIGGGTSKLFIAYDATSTTSAKTRRIWWNGDGGFFDTTRNCGSLVGGYESHEFVQINGGTCATGSTPIEANITKEGNSYGVVLNANYACAVGNFICQHRESLTEALTYRLLIEFLEEAYHSNRVNKYTIYNDREEIHRQLYGDPANPRHVGYYDQMAQKIERALDQIEVSDPICFECDQDVKTISTIP